MKSVSLPILLAIAMIAASPVAAAQEKDDESIEAPEPDYRGGTLRLGAFNISGVKARLYFGPNDIPLRAVIDVQEDLGMRDSLTAFRGNFMYRFSKHHAVSLGYYKLDLDGIRRLSRPIELGDTEFDIGVDVRSHYKEEITKLAYNWIFHDEGRVMLSLTPGLHFSDASLAVEVVGTGIGGTLPIGTREDRSVLAPLPMIGGRLLYRLTDKWNIVASSDTFFLDHGSQEGQLNDFHVFAEYQASEHWSFGGGLNRFSLDLQIVDDDIIWDWSSVYTGAYLFVGVNF
jgi:hypothetical protein